MGSHHVILTPSWDLHVSNHRLIRTARTCCGTCPKEIFHHSARVIPGMIPRDHPGQSPR